jgi:RNA polymerase sigma-B factor
MPLTCDTGRDRPATAHAPRFMSSAGHRGRDGGDAALLARYHRNRDAADREAIVTRYLPLARHLARGYRASGDIDDLHQVASLGLLKAIDRFDPGRGLAFSSFAVPTILGELRRYFRDHGWVVRVPRDLQERKQRLDSITEGLTAELGRSPTIAELADSVGATPEQVLDALGTVTAHFPDSLDRPGQDADDPLDLIPGYVDPGFEQVEDGAIVDDLLYQLPDRDRLILRLRFHGELTQAEIGGLLGLSQMQISRLIRRSIATLQDLAPR